MRGIIVCGVPGPHDPGPAKAPRLPRDDDRQHPLSSRMGHPLRLLRVALQNTRIVADHRSAVCPLVALVDGLPPFPSLLLFAPLHLVFQTETLPLQCVFSPPAHLH